MKLHLFSALCLLMQLLPLSAQDFELSDALIFEGKLDGKYAIRLLIKNSSDEAVSACYHYEGISLPITLAGNYQDGRLTLKYEKAKEPSETFEGTIDGNGVYKGFWIKKDKKLPFELKALYGNERIMPANFEVLLKYSSKLKLPLQAEGFDKKDEYKFHFFYRDHLFASKVQGTVLARSIKELIGYNERAYFDFFYTGAYFYNKKGNTVYLFFETSSLLSEMYAVILDKNNKMLSIEAVGMQQTGSLAKDSFTFRIDADGILYITNIGTSYSESGTEIGTSENVYDLSGDKVITIK